MWNEMSQEKDGAAEASKKILQEFLQNYLHTTNSKSVHERLEELIKDEELKPSLLEDEVGINAIKYISRLHGLPRTFRPVLTKLIVHGIASKQDNAKSDQISMMTAYKASLALKYAVIKDPEFITDQELIIIIREGFSHLALGENQKHEIFMRKEINSQVLLTLFSLIPHKSVRYQLEDLKLERLEDFTVNINDKYKAQVERSLASIGYKKGVEEVKENSIQFQLDNYITTNGQARIDFGVNSEVVISQEMNVEEVTASEKELERLSTFTVTTYLGESEDKQVVQAENVRKIDTKVTGSDRRWYRNTRWEVSNFLQKSSAEEEVKPNDIKYLKRKFTGFKFTLRVASTKGMIAETIFNCSKSQDLDPDILAKLVGKVLKSRTRKTGKALDKMIKTRSHILQAVKANCERNGSVNKTIYGILSKFIQTSGKEMGRELKEDIFYILLILSEDGDEDLGWVVECLTEDIAENCEYEMNFIKSKIKTKKMKNSKVVPHLFLILEKFKEGNAEQGACSLALELLEEFLQLPWAEALEAQQINKLIKLYENPSLTADMEISVIKCILRSLEKGRLVLGSSYFAPFKEDELKKIFQVLFKLNTLVEDIRLRILNIVLLSSLLATKELNDYAKLCKSQDFEMLTMQLARKDIILMEIRDGGNLTILLENDEAFIDGSYVKKKYEFVSGFVMKLMLMLIEANPHLVRNESVYSTVGKLLIESNGKLTRILCAEFIYKVVSTSLIVLKQNVLDALEESMNSPIRDVCVYSKASYCKAMANQAEIKPELLDSESVNFLLNLYSFKRIEIDQIDFGEEINLNILKVIQKSLERGMDLPNFFEMFARILNKSKVTSEISPGYLIVETVLDCLKSCFQNKNISSIPSCIAESVENVLLESDTFYETCVALLEKGMKDGTVWLTEKALDGFAKKLWKGPPISGKMIEILSIANEKQELSESAFDIFQMELVGLRLAERNSSLLDEIGLPFGSGEPEVLIGLLQRYISKGIFISDMNLNVIRKNINGGLAQSLIYTIVNVKALPHDLIKSCLQKLKMVSFQFGIDFATGVVQRRRQLPEEFIVSLKEEFDTFLGLQNRQDGVEKMQAILELVVTIIHSYDVVSSTIISLFLDIVNCQKEIFLTLDVANALNKLVDTLQVREEIELKTIKEILKHENQSNVRESVTNCLNAEKSLNEKDLSEEGDPQSVLIDKELERESEGININLIQYCYNEIIQQRTSHGKNYMNRLATYLRDNLDNLGFHEKRLLFNIFEHFACHSLSPFPEIVVNIVKENIFDEHDTLLRCLSFSVLVALRKQRKLKWEGILKNTWKGPVSADFHTLCDGSVNFDEYKSDFKQALAMHSISQLDRNKVDAKIEEGVHLITADTVLLLAKTREERLKLYQAANVFCYTLERSPLTRLYLINAVKEYFEMDNKFPISELLDHAKSAFVKNEAYTNGNKQNFYFTNYDKFWLDEEIKSDRASKSQPKANYTQISNEELREALNLLQIIRTEMLGYTISKINFTKIAEKEFSDSKIEEVINHFVSTKWQGLFGGLEFKDSRLQDEHMWRYPRNIHEKMHYMKLVLVLRKFSNSKTREMPEAIEYISKLETYTDSLLRSGYDYSKLEEIFDWKDFRESGLVNHYFAILENVLCQLKRYKVKPDVFVLIQQKMIKKGVGKWVDICNEYIMNDLYSGTQGQKAANRIAIEYLRDNNTLQDKIPEHLMNFQKIVNEVRDGVGGQDINFIKWAEDVKSKFLQYTPESLKEHLKIISSACNICRGYPLNTIQILALYAILLEGDNEMGKLLEVSTGSGKSTIIACLAVLKCLKGLHVDVYTSNSELAKRDSESWQKFYNIFGLNSANNCDDPWGYANGEKICYKSDIVYGEISQFQFDTLRQEYSGLGTRGERKFEYGIVDEVDSALLDDCGKVARLSCNLPGMELFQIVYHLIWHRLEELRKGIHFDEKIGFYYQIGRGQRPFVTNKANYADELRNAGIIEVANVNDFVKKHLKDYTNALLLGEYSDGNVKTKIDKLPLPKHLREFGKNQVDKWVDSALTALVYKENVNYLVENGEIKLVDYQSTGTIKSLTYWNNGLHQFLQIKHFLKVTNETVTTNFLSNRAMLKRYGVNFVGFTGTLGSKWEIKFLKDAFQVESIIIPDIYHKRFRVVAEEMYEEEEKWNEEIVYSALHESYKRRAVLVICQSIQHAEVIAKHLKSKMKMGNIKLFTRNDKNQDQNLRVDQGDIIVSTNVLGRGADINTRNVEGRGGLHVILTFLPESSRVEEQAFGRTARQGNKGTRELLMLKSSRTKAHYVDRYDRDQDEERRLKSFQENQLKMIEKKDDLFIQFCKFYSEIRGKFSTLFSQTVDNLVLEKGHLKIAFFHFVETEWATLLKRVEDGVIKINEVDKIYNRFVLKVNNSLKDVRSAVDLTGNTFYWTNLGNEYYLRDFLNYFLDNTGNALNCFEKAIKNDPGCAVGANAGIGFCFLKGKQQLIGADREDGYKREAINRFKKGLDILYKEISFYNIIERLTLSRGGVSSSGLLKQLKVKTSLVQYYARNVERAIITVEKSLRAVYAVEVSQLDTGILVQEIRYRLDDYKPRITSLNESKLSTRLNLEFHDLTFGFDCYRLDQANGIIDVCEMVTIIVENQNVLELEKLVGIVPIVELQRVTDVNTLLSDIETNGLEFALKVTSDKKELLKELGKALKEKTGMICWTVEDEERWEMRNVTSTKLEVSNKQIISLDRNSLAPAACKQFDLEIGFKKGEDLGEVKRILGMEENVNIIFKFLTNEQVERGWVCTQHDPSLNDCAGFLQQCNGNLVVFKNLPKDNAKAVVSKLRDKEIGFVLAVENLSFRKATEILERCGRAQEDLEQRALMKMGEQFVSKPEGEIKELVHRGLLLMPEFAEMSFLPWRSATAIGILTGIQLAVGSALISTGFGALGVGLVKEGVSDLMKIYTILSSREFSWQDYAIQKAVGLSVSMVTVGLSSTVSEGSDRAIQGVSKAFKETVTRTVLNKGVEAVVKVSLESIRKEIEDAVNSTIFERMKEISFLKNMAIYNAFYPGKLVGMMEGLVRKATGDRQEENMQRIFTSIANQFFQAISKPALIGSTFSILIRLGVVVNGCQELAAVSNFYCDYLENKLKSERESCTPSKSIQTAFGLISTEADDIVNRIKSVESSPFEILSFLEREEPIDSHKTKMDDIVNHFKKLNDTVNCFKPNCDEFSRAQRLIGVHVTKKIIEVVSQQLVSPVTTYAVGQVVEPICSFILSNQFNQENKNVIRPEDKALLQETAKRSLNPQKDMKGIYTNAYQKDKVVPSSYFGIQKKSNENNKNVIGAMRNSPDEKFDQASNFIPGQDLTPKEVVWLKMNDDTVVDTRYAVFANPEDQVRLFVVRAAYKGGVFPGYGVVGLTEIVGLVRYGRAHITCNSKGQNISEYEMLIAPKGSVKWEKMKNNTIPSNAVRGGQDHNGNFYYIGRSAYYLSSLYGLSYMCGKIDGKNCKFYFNFDRAEKELTEFDVLVYNEESSSTSSTDK